MIGNLIYIKQPKFNELDYIVQLWSDERTMIDVGGVVELAEEKRKPWYSKMVNPTDGLNFYCLIYTKDDLPVGEVSFHRFDKALKSAELNIKVQYKYRGKGYAKEALEILLYYYFNVIGGQVMLDNVININGQEALKKFGFEVISESGKSILFKMTKERFISIYGNNSIV